MCTLHTCHSPEHTLHTLALQTSLCSCNGTRTHLAAKVGQADYKLHSACFPHFTNMLNLSEGYSLTFQGGSWTSEKLNSVKLDCAGRFLTSILGPSRLKYMFWGRCSTILPKSFLGALALVHVHSNILYI